MHVVLLGDSIFDNGAYVRRDEPDVVRQLQAKLPAGGKATLRAVDGAVTTGVARQVEGIPGTASHLVLSVGGNDALRHAGILEDASRSIADALNRLAAIADEFERSYRSMLTPVLGRRLPTAVSTIYYPRFPDPRMQRLSVTALTLFNDAIIRTAFENGLALLDLRLICNEDADYANPIEPSAHGGEKIASAIVRLVAEYAPERGRSEVFAR